MGIFGLFVLLLPGAICVVVIGQRKEAFEGVLPFGSFHNASAVDISKLSDLLGISK